MTLIPVSKISVLVEDVELRRRPVDRPRLLGGDRTEAVNGLADQIEHPAEDLLADRHLDRLAGVDDRGAALQAVGRAQSDRAHPAPAEVLGDLAPQDLTDLLVEEGAIDVDLEGVVDRRHRLLGKLRIEGGTYDLCNRAVLCVFHRRGSLSPSRQASALAPPMMSRSSIVM